MASAASGAAGAGGPPQVRFHCAPHRSHIGAAQVRAQPQTQADCIRAVQHYILKMLRPKDVAKAIAGAKALILDRETVCGVWQVVPGCDVQPGTHKPCACSFPDGQKTIVSMVQSMSDILSKEGGWALFEVRV